MPLTAQRVLDEMVNTEGDVLSWAIIAVGVADDAKLSPEDRAVLLPGIFHALSQRQVIFQAVGAMSSGAQLL